MVKALIVCLITATAVGCTSNTNSVDEEIRSYLLQPSEYSSQFAKSDSRRVDFTVMLDDVFFNLIGADFSESWLDGASFHKKNLRGANFSKTRAKNVDFSRAILEKTNFNCADLTGADFRDASFATATFYGAILTDVSGLDQEKLDQAKKPCDFSDGSSGNTSTTTTTMSVTTTSIPIAPRAEESTTSNPSEIPQSQETTTTPPVKVTSDYCGFSLQKLDLRKADFTNAILSSNSFYLSDIRGVSFRNAKLWGSCSGEYAPNFACTNAEGADFSGAKMLGSNSVLRFTSETGCDPKLFDGKLSNFTNANFSNINFIRTLFSSAKLDNANFTSAKLSDSGFRNSSMKNVSFRGATLSNIDFVYADLTNADFTGAIIQNCDFSGAKLDGVIGL